jgi:hypothetical protein
VSRCHSWTPVPDRPAGHSNHLPGECRSCWKPCHRRAESGQRCAECWYALAQHDDDRVRRSVLDEPGVPHEVLELLATDHSSPIASAAAARLADPSDTLALAPPASSGAGGGGDRRFRHPQVTPSDASWIDDVLSPDGSGVDAPRD